MFRMQGRLLCGSRICVQNVSNVPVGTLAQLSSRSFESPECQQLECFRKLRAIWLARPWTVIGIPPRILFSLGLKTESSSKLQPDRSNDFSHGSDRLVE